MSIPWTDRCPVLPQRTISRSAVPLNALFRSLAPSAVEKSGSPGRRRGPAPLAAKKSGCPGRERGLAPLVAKKSGCPGRKRGLAPLADKTNGCPGRKRGPAPLVVMVFVVRWTRWDFRGCTWYTECGSEGLLGLGQWTWYRPSKWTWSTKGCQSNGNGRVKNVNYTVCQSW